MMRAHAVVAKRRRVLGLLGMAAIALATAYGSGALAPAGLAGAPVKVVRFEFQSAAGDTATGDGLSDSESGDYADYRIASGASPVCVEAEGGPTALSFNILNRKMDATGTRCGDVEGTVRQYTVDVADSVSCQELFAYDPDYVQLDLDSSGDPYSPCRLTGADNPRIRVSNLWANKLPAKTAVKFHVSSFSPPFPEHGGFEIASNGEGTVLGSTDFRTVSYNGTASLVKFVGKTKPVGGVFPLKLNMVFERVTP